MVIVKAADKTAVDSSTQVGFISRMTSSSEEFVSEIFSALLIVLRSCIIGSEYLYAI